MIKLRTLPECINFCATIGNLPSSYMQSLSYEEQILWLCKFLEKDVLPAFNNNTAAVEELQNWFNNLDVQEEINNKLEEMAESGELQEIISEYLNSKAVFGYDTVADMTSSTNLIDGSYAKTLGYYEINDGGSGTYKIRTITNEDVVDGGSIIAMEDESLVAELIVKDLTVSIEQFGAKGNNTDDDTTAIQNALDFLTDGMTLNFSNKHYLISSQLNSPSLVNLIGNDCTLHASSSFNGSYMIYYGSRVPLNSDFENIINYKLEKFKLIAPTSLVLNGIYANKTVVVNGIYSYGLNKTVNCNANDYIDFIQVENINIAGKTGTDYAINTGTLGDGRTVKNIHLHVPSVVGSPNILKIGNGHNSLKAETIINGNIYIGASNVTMNDLHLESGNITIDGSNLKLSNVYIRKNPAYKPIIINNWSNVEINNLIVAYYDSYDYTSDDCIDITMQNRCNVKFSNCYKNMQGTIYQFKANTGIKTNINDFNKNMCINAVDSINKELYIKSPLKTKKVLGGSGALLDHIYTDGNNKWKKETGTYYYKVLPIFDTVRMIGSTSNTSTELSIALTNNGNTPLIQLSGRPYSNVRIYRGTTSGSYNLYSDIGLNDNQFVDNGIICAGNTWNSRESGAVDTVLDASSYEELNVDNVLVYAHNKPTIGTWKKGDIIIYEDNYAGSRVGWICTEAGTPGTWKSFGTIES